MESPCEEVVRKEVVLVRDTPEGRAFMVIEDPDNETVSSQGNQMDLDYLDYWVKGEADLPETGPWRGFKLGSQNASLPPAMVDMMTRVRLIFLDRLIESVNIVNNLTFTDEENMTLFYNLDMSTEKKNAIVGVSIFLIEILMKDLYFPNGL